VTAQPIDAAPAQAADVVRVLVVDDTPTLRMLTRLTLEGTGFEVVGEAGDGQVGLQLVVSLRPDLVLLDLAMPVMDGLEALPLMKAAAPEARVVIVSGFDRRAMEEQVVAAGADAYLQKGATPEATLEVLSSLFPRTAQAAGTPARPDAALAPPSAADARLEQLEEDLEQVLYVVSHDLAEPVHVIKGFAERLSRRARSDDEAEFCAFIVDAADRMQELLDDLLDYARAGRGELPQELLDCRRVVDNVLAGLGAAVADSGGRVTVGQLPRDVVANRLVLTQVLHNLVANAVKFARPGVPPVVRVEASTTPGLLTLAVSDNGLGIPAEQHERVFQPFKRLHPRDRYPGSGIGLAICRRLVERQGGSIWVESDGEGSTFFVTIPA
jgi:two-component system sensor histidine kinase/response regulator